MKVGTSESDLGRGSLCVCVWGLGHNTACVVFIFGRSLSFAVSASVFVSVSICWCLSIFLISLCSPLFVYAFCCLSVIYNQRQTQYIWGKMSTNPFSVMAALSRHRFVIRLSWLVWLSRQTDKDESTERKSDAHVLLYYVGVCLRDFIHSGSYLQLSELRESGPALTSPPERLGHSERDG